MIAAAKGIRDSISQGFDEYFSIDEAEAGDYSQVPIRSEAIWNELRAKAALIREKRKLLHRMRRRQYA